MSQSGYGGLLIVGEKDAKDEIGVGTYGKVFRVDHCGAPCAAKEFHVNGPKGFAAANNCSEFLKVCKRILYLRHPNLVEFFGVCYKQDTFKRVPLLLMEIMGESLTELLERCSKPASNMNLAFRHKLSILLNVTRGLQYLHSLNPPVAHCRLSSNKVLLMHPGTDQMQVKISDTGVVYLVHYNSRGVTKFPGSHFLPTESAAEFDPHKCDCALDVFSFGGIVLHTVTEQWPKPLDNKSVRSNDYEISRRSLYIEKISTNDVACFKLKTLVLSCLDDNSGQRPPIPKVLQTVANILGDLSSTESTSASNSKSRAIYQANEQHSQGAGCSGQIVPLTAMKPSVKIKDANMETYKHEFKLLDSHNNGSLTVEKVSVELKKIGVKDVNVQTILRLCGRNGDDHINIDEFCVARWIAERIITGKTAPDNLPSGLLDANCGEKSNGFGPQDLEREKKEATNRNEQTEKPTERAGGVGHAGSFTEINDSWEIPQNKLECFQLEFNALDGQKNGYLTVEKASVFLKSLELDDIKIWALCDQDGDGFVSINEYCAARWIALRAMNNVTIPDKMPSDLQPSISNRNNKHNVPRFENKQKDGLAEMQAELEKARNELKEKTADIEKKNKIIETMKKQLGCLPIAARCTVENLMDHVIVNQKVSVIVMLKNSLGQAVPGRKESIAVILSSAKQIIALPPHSIEDQRSGHYRISFFLNHVGYHELNILVCEISIPGMPHRIWCLSSSSPALDPAYGPKVKPLQNLKFNCYFNSILQAINQTQGVAHLKDKYKDGVIRPYVLSFVDSDSSKTPNIAIEVTGNPGLVLQEMNAILDEFDLEKSPSFVIQAENLLNTLAASLNQQRFVSYTQEDSHELLQHFLYELKKEEVNCIKASIFNQFGVTADPLSHVRLQNEYKIAMKYYLRVASKVTTPIDEIFSGVKLNTVICRECRSPSQTLEPFFDISLGVIKDMQNKDFSEANYWQQQHQHQSRQTRSNIASGGGSPKHPPMWDPKKAHKINYDAKSAQDLLVKKKMPYLPTRDNHESDIASGLERSLTDHTAIDNMDEDNKFICQQCTNRKGDGKGSGGGSDDDVVLCLVAKQIIIHKLPKVLILHIKRFNIGDYMVKKDSTHITFPPILNMAPYCSNTCLEECCDANNNIFYGLYAVVEHKGVTLKSGHYVAHVRRRPPRDPKQYDCHGEYDQGAAYDGKWLYTSDEVIRESQWDDVKNCDAYLLFYELLPRKKTSSV